MRTAAPQLIRHRAIHFACAALLGLGASAVLAQDILVPAGSTWRYLDDGAIPPGAWAETEFDDSVWPAGPAQLGYGDGDEATVVRFGPSGSDKRITTCFRHTFDLTNVSRWTALTIRLLRDDGAVVYLNGVELFRDNLPAGPVTPDTRALTAIGGAAERTFLETELGAGELLEGKNVLAVEVHQQSPGSSDISFDLELIGLRPPLEVVAISPAPDAVAVDPSLPLTVSVTDPQGRDLTVTFHARAVDEGARPDFTLVALPDTQNYVSSLGGGTPSMFTAQADWIVANHEARNIVFVTLLGDCVQNGDNGGSDTEWRHATNAMYRLEDPVPTQLIEGIPYGIAVGNHDQSPGGDPAGTTAFYNQFFGAAHFAGRSYYGGHFGTNSDNHYELFSASGLDFIVLHLEYDSSPDPEVLAWAGDLLQTHPDRRAIVVSHYLMNPGEGGAFSGQGQATYDALKGHPNLFLMLCGHVTEEGRRTDVFQGNTVHTLLSDYQNRSNGGDGWLRLLEFSPSNHVIRVQTYSPTLDRFETDPDSEFILGYDMGRPFTAIGGSVEIASGASASVLWPDLAPATTYEWYVTVSDGARTTSSPLWRFTTAFDSVSPTSVLRISSLRVVDGQVRLSWTSVPGQSYRVCTRNILQVGPWADLSEPIQAAGSVTSWTTPIDPAAQQRFYAVRLVDP